MYKQGVYKDWDESERVRYQLFQQFTVMPWDVFKAALCSIFGRQIKMDTAGWYFDLRAEYSKTNPAPTVYEINALIPKEYHIEIKPQKA